MNCSGIAAIIRRRGTVTMSEQEMQFSQVEAEAIVRLLWIAFNSIGLYGNNHPLTIKAHKDLGATLAEALKKTPSLTIHVEQNTLACEEWRISPKSIGERLIARLKSAGLFSMTFQAGFVASDLIELLTLLADGKRYPTVDAMSGISGSGMQKGFRFNYITYQKVALDDSVVRKDLRTLAALLGSGAAPCDDTPPETSSQIAGTAGENTSSLIARLRALREQVHRRMTLPAPALPPPDEIIQILSSLRNGILDDLRRDTVAGRISSTAAEVMTELERLTFEVTIRIICEQYRSKQVSIKKLADIIRRLVTDTGDIVRMLPMLKIALLKEGMPIAEYLQLAKELALQAESEELLGLFSRAGEEIGATVDEIVADFRKDPRAAVRLIVAAAELRSLMGVDENRFCELLSDYIRKVSTAGVSVPPGDDQHPSDLEASLRRFERQLIDHMAGEGVKTEIVSVITQALTVENPATPQTGTDNGLPSPNGDGNGAAGENGCGIGPGHAASGDGTSSSALLSAGNASSEQSERGEPEQTTSLFSKPRTGPAGPRKPPSRPGILRPREVTLIVEREAKRSSRYKTALSCISMSIIKRLAPGESPLERSELAIMQPHLCQTVAGMIRELDWVGPLGSIAGNLLLVILPNTGNQGAEVVCTRMQAELLKNGINVEIRQAEVVIAAQSYDPEQTTAEFLRRIKRIHRKRVQAIHTQTDMMHL
jgi:hypothetical protein